MSELRDGPDDHTEREPEHAAHVSSDRAAHLVETRGRQGYYEALDRAGSRDSPDLGDSSGYQHAANDSRGREADRSDAEPEGGRRAESVDHKGSADSSLDGQERDERESDVPRGEWDPGAGPADSSMRTSSFDSAREGDSAGDLVEERRQAAQEAGAIDQDGRVPVERTESGDRVRGWPHDDTGYAVRDEDLTVLGIDHGEVELWQRFEAPLGMTPDEYEEFTGSLQDALAEDGIDPSHVDIRLQGSSAQFFSGAHKDFPGERDIADQPEAKARWEAWVGDRPDDERPSRVPFDAKARLGMVDADGEPEDLSDYDVQLSSDAMVSMAREAWDSGRHDDDGKPFVHPRYDFIDKSSVAKAFPALTEWKERWEGRLGREVAPALFRSSGPTDKRIDGVGISTHFRETDWIINRPGRA